MPNPLPQTNVKPIVLVIACLGIVAFMFFGSIAIGYVYVHAGHGTAPVPQSEP